RYADRLTLRLPSGDEKAWLPSFEKMRPDRRSGLALGDSDIMRVQDETAHGEIEGTIQLFGPAAITWARASAKRAQRRGQRGVVGIDRLAVCGQARHEVQDRCVRRRIPAAWPPRRRRTAATRRQRCRSGKFHRNQYPIMPSRSIADPLLGNRPGTQVTAQVLHGIRGDGLEES